MKYVNITIVVTSCDDPDLSVKYEGEQCSVDHIVNAQPINLLKHFVEQLLEMEGANDQPTDPVA